MTGTFDIAYLADHPEFAPTLARWHRDEWGALMPYWTYEHALAELRGHTRRCALPTTLIARAGGQLTGSVSLVVDDLQEWIGTYSPWLASLYVPPPFRGRGIGQALVNRLVQEAGQLAIPRLHVFAANSEAFYTRLGWTVLERVEQHGVPSAVMAVTPPIKAASRSR